MLKRAKFHGLLAALLILAVAAFAAPASAAPETMIFTSRTSLSAPPGETINYSVDLINNSSEIKTAQLSFSTTARGWTYELTSGGHTVHEIAVKPNDFETVNLSLTVPLEVEKGEYSFQLIASEFGRLPLKVTVTEKGSYQSVLSADQPNMQGHADSNFTYSLTLSNRTAEKQQYALTAEAPAGWSARFTSGGSNITSVEIEPNASKTISLNLTPAENAKADTYKIAVHAASGSTSADTEVEAVITGTYNLELTTADERLSSSVTAGRERKLELILRNTGSADLSDISMTATSPSGWEVSFEPKNIALLKAGESRPVTATIKSSEKSLAGDYLVGLSAQADEKSAHANIRMTVKTSVLWGWVGVLIIAAVAAGVYGLFRKYGRR
jgi:uncharacterized membrane protein